MAGVKGPRPCLGLLGKGDWPHSTRSREHTHIRAVHEEVIRELEHGLLLSRARSLRGAQNRRLSRSLCCRTRHACTCLSGILARRVHFFFLNDLMDSFHSYKAPESVESERERIDPEENSRGSGNSAFAIAKASRSRRNFALFSKYVRHYRNFHVIPSIFECVTSIETLLPMCIIFYIAIYFHPNICILRYKLSENTQLLRKNSIFVMKTYTFEETWLKQTVKNK